MFENLTDRLSQTLRHVTGKAKLTEDNIKDTLREVRMALLEADVALPVVKDFVSRTKDRAVGTEVSKSLTPGQAFVKIVQAELVEQFIQACGIYPTGTLVELSNGQVAVITEVHSLKRLRPRVMLLLGPDKSPLERFRELDMGETEFDETGAPLTIRRGLPNGSYGLDPVELFLV